MKLPNICASFLLAVLFYALNWLLGHIGAFSIPPEYLTIVTGLLGVAIAAVAKLVQERNPPEPPATLARGMVDLPQHGYWTRVFVK